MLKNLKNNDVVKDFFLVLKKDILVDKNGRNYLNVDIGDKSGSINGKLWDIKDNRFENINEGDVVFITGKIEKFKDNLQIKIEKFEKKEVDESVYNNLIPSVEKNLDKIVAEIINFKNSISLECLKKLIDKIIFDENFLPLFKMSPAATKFHHAYRGGLAEHTLSVAKLCDKFTKVYPLINRDILLSGAILHDIGKVFEYDNKTFNRTDEGKLVGHIAIGVTLLDKRASKIKDLPIEILNSLKHLILSHHGEMEWGSPVPPLTMEALLLHFADNIDSKVQSFLEIDAEKSGWYYNKSLRKNVLIGEPEEAVSNIKISDKNKEKKNIKTLFS